MTAAHGLQQDEGPLSAESIRERVLAAPAPRVRLDLSARSLRRRRSGRRGVGSLVEALRGIASAAAVGGDLEESLDAIAVQARRITDADKAALALVRERAGGIVVDDETVVARGPADQLPQSWWVPRVERLTPEMFRTATVMAAIDPDHDASLMCSPVPSGGGSQAVLCVMDQGRRSYSPDEKRLLGILGVFAGSAIENARLADQARHSLLVGERERIAKDMHDGLAQTLFSASLGLKAAHRVAHRDSAQAVDRIRDVQDLITDGMIELRHYIYDLRAPRLERMGLVEALESFLESVGKDVPAGARLTVLGEYRTLEDSTEACLYRVAREGISNAVRHAACTHLDVTIDFGTRDVVLSVRDDGRGFDVGAVARASVRRGSLGLGNIRERAGAVGGTAQIASSPGHGTTVRVRVPCR